MTENDWLIYGGAEATGTNASEDTLTDELDLVNEIANADSRFVEMHYAGETLAGQLIDYSFNRWGQLQMHINGHELKGGVRAGIYRGILNSRLYFSPIEEMGIGKNWTLISGVLFPDGSQIDIGILMHSNQIIGIYKEGTDVGRTIRWFEKNIYKGNWKQMKVHKLTSYRPEYNADTDVYHDQEPEFTREAELEDIYTFISSLKGRKHSAEELQLLHDIQTELADML